MRQEERDTVAFVAGQIFVFLMLSVFFAGFIAGRASAPAAAEATEKEGGR